MVFFLVIPYIILGGENMIYRYDREHEGCNDENERRNCFPSNCFIVGATSGGGIGPTGPTHT